MFPSFYSIDDLFNFNYQMIMSIDLFEYKLFLFIPFCILGLQIHYMYKNVILLILKIAMLQEYERTK